MKTKIEMKDNKSIKGYLFNLIVYTHEEKRLKYFQNIVQAFMEKYPCRVIFVSSREQDKEDFIEAKTVYDKDLNGTCDQFAINVSKSLVHTVPFVILPKLIPDLPIYLVWGQNLTSDNELLPELQQFATRIVFDSVCAKDLHDFSTKMLEKIQATTIDYMDVSWATISGWRDAIAQTFQTQEKIDYLQKCGQLIIQYNNAESELIEHPALQAIFLQGWLAAQLDWKFESISYAENITLQYKTPKSKVKVVLQPQKRETIDPGRVFEVEFQGLNHLHVSMTLAEKQAKVTVYEYTPNKCELPFSFSVPDLSKGLTAIKEVFYYRSSEHYTKMLEVIKEIPWKQF